MSIKLSGMGVLGAGSVSSKTSDRATQAVSYDDANSLTTSTTGSTLAYNTEEQLQSMTEDSGTHYYYYDDRGNQDITDTVEGPFTVTAQAFSDYNDANQMVDIAVDTWGPRTSASADYQYDGNGLMTSKSVTHRGDTTSADSVYDWDTVSGSVPTMLEDGSYYYVYGDDSTPIAQIDKDTHAVQYLYEDQLGSVRAVADASGTLDAEYEYDAYGTVAQGEQSHTTSAFGFAGQYLDTDTNLYYMRARWYDPSTGQFTSVDPDLSDTHTSYGYATSNPLLYTDPSGLDGWDAVNGETDKITSIFAPFSYGTAWLFDNNVSYDPNKYSLSHEIRDLFGVQTCVNQDCNNGQTGVQIAATLGLAAAGAKGGGDEGSLAEYNANHYDATTGITPRGGVQVKQVSGQYRNPPQTINGYQYTGHAVDQIQDRNIPSSVVNDIIANGVKVADRDGGWKYVSPANNYTVVTNADGEIITVKPGAKIK